MPLLDEADGRRIEAAIAELEERSAAEFVVAVIPRSARYSRYRALVAGMWALGAAVAYFRFVPWGSELWGLLLELPVGLFVWSLLGLPPLQRLLISKQQAERAVRGEAFRIFAERGVYKTRDRTGMLLVISELEHQVVLLGDEGIHEKVGTAGWERHVEHVIRSIREKRTADGIIDVIRELQTTLEEKIPVTPGDVDELSNRLLRET